MNAQYVSAEPVMPAGHLSLVTGLTAAQCTQAPTACVSDDEGLPKGAKGKSSRSAKTKSRKRKSGKGKSRKGKGKTSILKTPKGKAPKGKTPKQASRKCAAAKRKACPAPKIAGAPKEPKAPEALTRQPPKLPKAPKATKPPKAPKVPAHIRSSSSKSAKMGVYTRENYQLAKAAFTRAFVATSTVPKEVTLQVRQAWLVSPEREAELEGMTTGERARRRFD